MTQQKFKVKLVKDAEVGGWTKFDIPFNVEKEFGQKGYVKVKGTIDKQPFNNIKLMPIGDGTYCMAVKEELRKTIDKGNGEVVTIVMELDKDELSIPDDLSLALSNNKKAQEFFNSLSESNKNYYVNWVTTAKKDETRQSRIEKTIKRLFAGLKFGDK
jgi:hypothetical protein